jgi:hypothetical protein
MAEKQALRYRLRCYVHFGPTQIHKTTFFSDLLLCEHGHQTYECKRLMSTKAIVLFDPSRLISYYGRLT